MKGNVEARGNPVARRMWAMRAVMLAAIDKGTVEQATRQLAGQAAAGDLQAIKLLFEYVIGKPAQAIELSGPGGERLGIDLTQMQAVIFAALGPHPEARAAVGLAMRKLINEVQPGGPDRPEPGD